MDKQSIPVSIPDGWSAENVEGYGLVIEAKSASGRWLGAVTVDEDVRGFALGMVGVRSRTTDNQYVGRGWRAKLYADAIRHLQTAYAGELEC